MAIEDGEELFARLFVVVEGFVVLAVKYLALEELPAPLDEVQIG